MKRFLLPIIFIITFSCVKEPEEEPTVSVDLSEDTTQISDSAMLGEEKHYGKLLVLNEGLFRQGNASLSIIDLKDTSVVNNVFLNLNGQKLGDTGNDMRLYGGKIYIVLHGSSTVEVINSPNCRSQ